MIIKKIVVGKYAVNCYMIICDKTKEAIVIDPGDHINLIKREIDKYNANIKYIVLTHGHGDHIGAVLSLKELTDAKIIVSEDEDELLQNAVYNGSISIFNKAIEIQADIFSRDNDNYNFGEISFRVIKTPGHTLGGMCILIENNLFSGDTLFRNSVGRTDLYSGNMKTLVNSILYKLFILDENTIVYPGHGPSSTIGYEKKNNPHI